MASQAALFPARPCFLLYMDCKKAGVCLCLLLVAVDTHCVCVLKQRGKEKFEDLFYF